MTWTFDTPVLLEPYTTYGIDVIMLTSTNDWSSGIPYIKVTADEYSGGMRFTSPLSGTGTDTLSYTIASDRIFHLDIERPLGPLFELVATYPADDATGVFASRNLVLTFSQNVSPGSGSLTIRNLTDGTDTALSANDSRLTYDQNAVRIAPAGLLDWSKSYAIRIDAGSILGDGNAPIAAISDDTTWNFTISAGDPLLEAIAALKSHITGATPLSGPQIADIKTTIDNQRQRFADNSANISAVFDLIATYDLTKGPLFVTGSTVTDFSRNNTNPADKKSVSPENYHWVVYTVMQHAMDIIYNAAVLAEHETLLNTYKFGSHANFPGPCPPPADPLASHSIQINGSFPITFGRNTQQWTLPARKPTGTYLAPGTIATVTVPSALVNAGYKVRVGAHSWDLSGRAPVKRLERATRLYSIDSETIKVASPYGGGIYIEVPIGANAGVVNVTITGAVRAPYFSAKSFHATTPAEWDVERTHPAPWADFQSDKFMMQVPRKWIYNHPNPAQTMADWDASMDAINSLMGYDTNRGKETMYVQTDVILRSSVHAPGYPATNISSSPLSEVSPVGYANNYFVRGPGYSLTASNIEFHEQGHSYFFPKFGGESESTVNLLQPAMLNRAFGKTFDQAQNGSFGGSNSNITMDNTAVAWMTVFNFSPRNKPMAEAEKAYQYKGHAKYMDVARLFGWEKLDAYWRSFMEDDAAGITSATGTDALLLRLSHHVGKDITPLFHFWGIYPQNRSTLAAALAAENIPASPEIRNLLLHYKTLVPADNAAFRTFAQAWRGRKPTIKGAWEEREHARQWDQAALFGTNDHQRADITVNEEYIPACADQIRNRVQELVDLYYPSGINPVDLSFAIPPTPVDAITVGMVASTATAVGPVEYYFENLTNATNSGWISSATWQQNGLASGQTYSYRAKARDSMDLQSETNWSATASVSLTGAGDVTAPSPDPMTFATPPNAMDETTITMTATNAIDINAVEYEFENTVGGGSNSGWQSSPSFTDGELSPSTEYGYRVRARDSAGNLTAWTAVATANTADIPDLTPPQIASLSPANATAVTDLATNLVVTFDEPVLAGSGFITLKNLTDATQSQISVGDAAVSVAGKVMTINPPADLLYGKTYAVRIDDNAVADASNNPFIGINDDTTWSFDAILADPIANPGGPYRVSQGESVSLDGSGSVPSDGQTITLYEWDLNNDGVFSDVTGATPAAISDADLRTIHLMVDGPNTIQLRVTDSAGKSSVAPGTVNLFKRVTYTGDNSTKADRWNTGTTWDSLAVPTGPVDVVISAAKPYVTAWSASTPAYTGNLTMAPGSTLQVGWTTNYTQSYNALGTPGSTTITMGAGSLIKGRTAQILNVPAIVLQGNATWSNGESTQAPATPTFAYPITGPHKFTFQSNVAGNVTFAASNTFAEMELRTLGTRGGGQGTAKATAAGAFGTGDVSVTTSNGTIGYKLEFDVANVMSPTAALNLIAKGPSGDGSNRVQMDANNTIGTLFVDGIQLSAGTYGRVGITTTVDDQVSWMTGNSVLTVLNGTGQTPYAAWSGGAPFDADANNDRIANGLAWVLGAANPSENALGLLPTADNTDPGYFTFTYRRSQDAAATTTITAEYGSTLGSWSDAVHDNDNIIITETPDGLATGIDRVEVKIKRSFAGEKLFARLKVLHTTP